MSHSIFKNKAIYDIGGPKVSPLTRIGPLHTRAGAQTAFLTWAAGSFPREDAGTNKVLHTPVTVHRAQRQLVACGFCRTCGGKIREALYKSDWTLVNAMREGPAPLSRGSRWWFSSL